MERLRSCGQWLLVSAALAAAAPADVPASDPETHVAIGSDEANRMTVPVVLNGSASFRFMIDTGADRTVVSDRVAAALSLPAKDPVIMWSSTGRESVGTAALASLDVAGRRRDPFDAAVLHEDTLGASGVLGVDSLADRRVVLDFRTQEMAVAAAPEQRDRSAEERALARDPPGTIVITAKRKLGQLILTDASFHGHSIDVVVDTGAELSIGNLAFLSLVASKHHQLGTGEIIGVTGHVAVIRYAAVDELQLGPLTMHDAAIAFADLACFERFGLTKRPALLLGMNVLRQFDRVAIDFRRRRVAFLLNDGKLTPDFAAPIRTQPG